jgi:polyisoprenyl-teichoic acid--peptidoglycan teichoic acid transferase
MERSHPCVYFMDEFRNKQPGGNNRRVASSIDGFARGPKIDSTVRNPVFSGNTRNVQQTPRRLDNFSKAQEGFTPLNRTRTVQAAVAPTMTLTSDEPILIDRRHKNSGKRGLFGRKDNGVDGYRTRNQMSPKKKILIALGLFLTTALLIGGFLFYKGYINLNKVLKGGGGAAALEANVDPSKLKGEGDGRVNILLLGRGGEGHEAPDLTDTIMIASIDPIAKEAALVSIPRDLYVPVKGSSSMKINAVYENGKSPVLNKVPKSKQTPEVKRQAEEAGFKLLEDVIQKQLGLSIHYHAIVDFTGFRQAIDTVGGINVNVPSAVTENMRIQGKPFKLNVKPGVQQMDGLTALAYSRSRYTSARGDFDRAERQRMIIIALKEKVLSTGTFSNPAKISGLLDTLGSRVYTNFSVGDMQRLYTLGAEINQSKISSIGLADPPNNYVTTGNIGGQSVVIPRTGNGNFKEIQGYLRNVLKDSFIRSENASIKVLNGTATPGLAGIKGDELKSYGYNITDVANAPTKTYTKTVVVDMRGGAKKYTKNYLEKRFNTATVATIPDATILPGTADFVIILGSDQATTQ